MNDFTKEELIDIYDALMNTEIPIFENLPSKVQSMIDNYCEHEKDGRVYDGILGLSFRCLKCGKFI